MAGDRTSKRKTPTKEHEDAATMASPPKKFIRTSDWKGRKGPLSSGRKNKTPPRLHAIAHKDGTFVFISERTAKGGELVEFYSAPIQAMVDDDTHGFKKATGLDGVCTRRGLGEQRFMPKDKGSRFAWKVLVGVSPEGPDWTPKEVKTMQVKIVEEWNKHGEDTSVFEYPSKIVEGTIIAKNDGTAITLDQSILGDEVVDIIKLSYGIDDVNDLTELAEDVDIVTTYFSSYEEGKTVITNYVDTFTKTYN